MAVSFPSGFKITSAEAVDTRILLTKAEMLAMKKAQMPSAYFCICKEDGQLYLYNGANDIDPVTGRFRKFEVSAGEDFNAGVISQEQIKTLFQKEE